MANENAKPYKNLWENPYFRIPFISACLLGATCAIALVSIFGIFHFPIIGFATLVTAGTAGLIALLGVRMQRLADKMDQGMDNIQQVTQDTATVIEQFGRVLTDIEVRKLPEKYEQAADNINMIAKEIKNRELYNKIEGVVDQLGAIATEVQERQVVEKIHTTSTALEHTVTNSTLLSSVGSIGSTLTSWLPSFRSQTTPPSTQTMTQADHPRLQPPIKHARSHSSPK